MSERTIKPTDILKQEHRAIERVLTVLENIVGRMENGEAVSLHIVRDAIQFIQQFADQCHHGKEENILFTAMEQKGFSRDFGPLAVMLHEHEEGRSYVRGMLGALEAYESGRSEAIEELAFNARSFSQLLRDHIMKEDNVLFVIADQQFTEAEQSHLRQEFERVELTGQACMRKSALLDLLERIEKEVRQANISLCGS